MLNPGLNQGFRLDLHFWVVGTNNSSQFDFIRGIAHQQFGDMIHI